MVNSGVRPIRATPVRSDDDAGRTLDLQTLRHLEEFVRLVGWHGVSAAATMEIRHGVSSTFIEVEGMRVCMTVALDVEPNRAAPLMESLLAQANPCASGGLPLRAFRIGDACHLSCTLPGELGARRWLRVYRVLRRLIERAPTV